LEIAVEGMSPYSTPVKFGTTYGGVRGVVTRIQWMRKDDFTNLKESHATHPGKVALKDQFELEKRGGEEWEEVQICRDSNLTLKLAALKKKKRAGKLRRLTTLKDIKRKARSKLKIPVNAPTEDKERKSVDSDKNNRCMS